MTAIIQLYFELSIVSIRKKFGLIHDSDVTYYVRMIRVGHDLEFSNFVKPREKFSQ